MPALSWPRCCSAYRAKKASRAGSADFVAIATTPQASRGLLTVGLPGGAQVFQGNVQHVVNDYPRAARRAEALRGDAGTPRGAQYALRDSGIARDERAPLVFREERHLRIARAARCRVDLSR